MNTTRNNLTALRGLFAVMIFLHHFLPSRGVALGIDMGSLAVLFFFVLSGYSLTLSYKRRINETSFSYRKYLVHRGSKIYPIQWLTLALALYYDGGPWAAVPFHFTLTQSFVLSWKINWTLNTPSWFLSSLLFSYLVFPLLLRSFFKYGRKMYWLYVLAVVAWAAASVLLPSSVGRRWLCYINPFARVLDFMLGMILALQTERLKGWTGQLNGLIVTVLEALALSLVALSLVYTPWFPGRFIPKSYWYPEIMFLIALFASECRGAFSALFNIKPFLWIGEMSLSIYMFQMFCGHLFGSGMSDWPIGPALACMFAGLLAVSALATYVILPWCARWFTRIGNKLIGVKE